MTAENGIYTPGSIGVVINVKRLHTRSASRSVKKLSGLTVAEIPAALLGSLRNYVAILPECCRDVIGDQLNGIERAFNKAPTAIYATMSRSRRATKNAPGWSGC